MPCDFFCLQLEEGKICKSHQIYNTLRISVVCASAVVYYYFQGFSAGHKRIISYSSTWQKYFFFPPFQRWTQVNVIMTWFIIIWMDDGELIGFDGASCNAAYGTKYKLTGGCLRWSGKKKSFMWQRSVLIKSFANKHFHSGDYRKSPLKVGWKWKREQSPGAWQKSSSVNSEVWFFPRDSFLTFYFF